MGEGKQGDEWHEGYVAYTNVHLGFEPPPASAPSQVWIDGWRAAQEHLERVGDERPEGESVETFTQRVHDVWEFEVAKQKASRTKLEVTQDEVTDGIIRSGLFLKRIDHAAEGARLMREKAAMQVIQLVEHIAMLADAEVCRCRHGQRAFRLPNGITIHTTGARCVK